MLKRIILLTAVLYSAQSFGQEMVEVTAWQTYFKQNEVVGTIVIADARGEIPKPLQVYNAERATTRFSPASTYKIPHTLMALDSGVLTPDQQFKWDGTESAFALHNQDQTLSTAMRYSVIWVYRQLAAAIGSAQAERYLQQLQYGNARVDTDVGDYWIDGKLAISAIEQISFLKQLYANTLPFEPEHQQLVKDLIVIEQGENWILRAKTGWQGSYGWWVGWVESATGPVFFALNIDTPNRLADLPKREKIGRAVLVSLQVLPKQTAKN